MKKLFICLIVFLSLLSITDKNTHITEIPMLTQRVDSTLNEENIYVALLMKNIRFPKVVLSQIMIESGYLTSNLCKKNHNLLGMTVASQRETTALNEAGYAKYSNWFDCIEDYKLYQDYIFSKNDIKTEKQYISFLNRSYAKSPDYKQKLTYLSKRYEFQDKFTFLNYEKNIQ